MADTTFADLPVAARADVAVLGGGPAGICAATAAAEEGADVVLVERYGFLGGMATAGLVNPFMTYRREHVQVNAGLFERILQALSAKGGRSDTENGRAFDPDIMKIVADDLTTSAGVRLLFHTFLVDAVADGGRVMRGIVADKSGLRAVEADVFVDCTGDGDLAARAGTEFEKGRPEDGLCQPMTTYFRMANVDRDRMPPQQEINERYRAAKEAGEIENPRDDVHRAIPSTRDGEVVYNTTRVLNHDSTDAESLSEAELIGRRQVEQMVAFLKTLPGFENADLVRIAPQIGVRESRRIMGDYVLRGDDVTTAAKFDDAVGHGCFSIDIHNPTGTGILAERVPEGDWYDIPYRCLYARGMENLLMAGRPISADFRAHGSVRCMPISACTGEAAGVAAAVCTRTKATTHDADVEEIRTILDRRHALLS
ncbi:MAG: FAD-dependent oxidoreductase [Armatimonadota bacterium]